MEIDRRSALRKIAVGAGFLAGYSILPQQWTRPVIGHIILPAHAATSGTTLHDPCEVEVREGNHTTGDVVVKVTGFVTPPAANLPVTVTVTAVGGAGLSATGNTITSDAGTFEIYLTVGGGPGITRINATTTVEGAAGSARCETGTVPNTGCADVTCAGVGNVVYGSTATVTVSDTNLAADDDVNLFVNGVNLGLVAGANPAVPTTFNNVTINKGANTIRIDLVAAPVNGTSKQITVTNGGQTATINPAATATDYTVCGVC